jgi:hypothetical protein
MARTPVRKPEIKTLVSSRRISARSGRISPACMVPLSSVGIRVTGQQFPDHRGITAPEVFDGECTEGGFT